KRYKKLIGKTITLPLTNREIPIIADDYVDQEFGTGCVKITPAHDFNDYDVGQRHDLPIINVLNPDASINDDMPKAYRGLERFAARKKIVADLDAAGALEKTENHKLMVPRGDRSGAVLEPFLTDQWYVKTAPLAEPAIKAVENGTIKFVPENWSKTYYNWMHNIQDWCISRQLWWGHRIPAWYDDDGEVYVGEDETAVRKKHKLPDSVVLQQDDDVLDTWFSSALWPFATLGWPDKTPELEKFLPSNVLVTGFDIIFFWVARMIMMTLKFTGKVPFKEVYITGLIRDEHGQKMSKSKGNVLDPIDLIDGIERDALIEKRTSGMMQPQQAEKVRKRTAKEFPDGIRAHGTDALRFTLASLASPTRDINFDMGRLEGYRNFCNKLWNAARYVVMNTEGQDNGLSGELEFSLADRWIRSRLAHTIDEAHRHLRSYRFDLAARALYEFTWNDYCDWYLELAKATLHDDAASPAQLRGTRHTLCAALETLLRLLHPIMPFITEEVWQRIAPLAGRNNDEKQTIMRQPYPSADSFRLDNEAEQQMQWVMDFIAGIRRIRGEMDIAPGKPLPVLIENATPADRDRLQHHDSFLYTLARLESIQILNNTESAPESAVALQGDMRILVPMAGLIDKDAELARLTKLIGKAEKNLAQVQGKLSNKKFVANAPEEIVNKERERVTSLQAEISQLNEQQKKIATL
ncbi:MAG TPA: valine--tRNA ligase, partial [Gammaproteobacteria bacterium]|nr:valine--tRNA ligase [Gammaproteobacteria bacterium]